MMSMRLRIHQLVALCLLALALVLPAGCKSNSSNETDADQAYLNIQDEEWEKPDSPARDRSYYENVLAQLPLRLQDEYQDFSQTDTVSFEKAWMVGFYYFDHGGERELYALFSNNDLYRIRTEDMSLDWTVNTEARPLYAPVVSSQFVFWVTKGPRVVWYYREGQAGVDRQKRWEENLHVKPCSPPIANDAGIYFGSSEYFRVYGFNDEFEREMWFWPHNRLNTGRVAMQPHADEDRLYFYSENGRFYSINTADGSQNWVWPLDGETMVSARPRVKHGIIFMGTWDTNLYALNKSSKIMFAYPAGEPVVSTPFVEDYYIIFETPRYLTCVRAEFNDAGDGKAWLRLVNEEDLASGRDRPDEAHWKIPLVPENSMLATDTTVLQHPDRRRFKVLMKGETWIYLLESVGKRKLMYRVNKDTGEFDTELDEKRNRVPRVYDVTPFPFILQNDDEGNRTIYFATHEGYVFAMRE